MNGGVLFGIAVALVALLLIKYGGPPRRKV